jgi:dUTP pyrophosphatase
MSLTLQVYRIDPTVPLPSYGYDDDAAFDLYAAEEVVLAPGARAQVRTGIALVIPRGYVGLVWDKSGLSHTHGLKTLGGVVDAGYRGEVMVGIVNLGSAPYTLARHHKVAQMIIQKKETPVIVEVSTLPESDRGTRGFGSSGV